MDPREVHRPLRPTAKASGWSIEEIRKAWVASVANLPPDEMQTLLKALYPRAAEARRRKTEQAALTGHAVHVHGWRRVFGRPAFDGRPPGVN